MNYIDRIKKIAGDDSLGTGKPSALNAPIFVMTLGFDEKAKEMIRRELAERWVSAQKYIYLFDIDLFSGRTQPIQEDRSVPGSNVVCRYMGFPPEMKEQSKLTGLSFWLYQAVKGAIHTLNTLNNCSINVLCAAETKEALWSARCGMIMYQCVKMLGGDVPNRNLFAFLQMDLARCAQSQNIFREKLIGWNRDLPQEPMFPVYENGQPTRLKPCTEYFVAGDHAFTKTVLLDAMDSSNRKVSMRWRIHTAALLMDPRAGIQWPNLSSESAAIYSAFLYPRYADAHETDLALSWKACQYHLQEELHAQIAPPDMSDFHYELTDVLIEDITEVPGTVCGFRMGDLNRSADKKELDPFHDEEYVFGDAIKNEMDYFWVRTAAKYKERLLPVWQGKVRSRLAEICSLDTLERTDKMFVDMETVKGRMPISTKRPEAIPKGKPDEFAEKRIALARGIAAGYYAGMHTERLEALVTGKGLESDAVLSMILERSLNEEVELLAEERAAKLRDIVETDRKLTDEQERTQSAFVGDLQGVLNGARFDPDERRQKIDELLKNTDIVKEYADALTFSPEKIEGEIAKVLKKVYDLFKETGFEPIEWITPDIPDRIGCRLIGGMTVGNGPYNVVAGGADEGLKLYIDSVEPYNVIAMNYNA